MYAIDKRNEGTEDACWVHWPLSFSTMVIASDKDHIVGKVALVMRYNKKSDFVMGAHHTGNHYLSLRALSMSISLSTSNCNFTFATLNIFANDIHCTSCRALSDYLHQIGALERKLTHKTAFLWPNAISSSTMPATTKWEFTMRVLFCQQNDQANIGSKRPQRSKCKHTTSLTQMLLTYLII